MKYVTSSRDGTVKIWLAHNLQWDKTIKVTDGIWVTCTHYMTHSKRLVAASANRMISFYDLDNTNYNTPVSRIEGLVGIPLCIEYYKWPKDKKDDGKIETLLVGDDLGICHMWNFTKENWHTCQYKKEMKDTLVCHEDKIKSTFDNEVAKQFKEEQKQKKEERLRLKAKAKEEKELNAALAKEAKEKGIKDPKSIANKKKAEGEGIDK